MSNNSSSNNGVGFLSLLTLLFIGLKLGGAITWSWVWVLSPLWIPFGLAIAIGVPVGLVRGIKARRQHNSFASVVRRAPQDRLR